MTGPSDLNTMINASPSWIELFRKPLSCISFHTQNWNIFITSSHYHYTVQSVTSGRTYTTRIAVMYSGQRHTWPKISLLERTNTQNLHALYSIIKHAVYRFQIPFTLWNIYSHKYSNIYPHIIDSGFSWPRKLWTCFPVVTGILLRFICFTHIHKMSPFVYFSYSLIAYHARLSQIHLHNTSRKFISNSMLFVSIFTLTNVGEF